MTEGERLLQVAKKFGCVGFLLGAISIVPISMARAQDAARFSDALTSALQKSLPGFSITNGAGGTIRISGQGAQIAISPSIQDCPPKSVEACVAALLPIYLGFFQPIPANRFRIEIQLVSFDTFFMRRDLHLSTAHSRVFGPFQEECFRQEDFPVTEWDAQLLHTDANGSLAACMNAAQAAFAPFASKLVAPVGDAISELHGAGAANAILFRQVWLNLAQKAPGGILIAVPDADTVFYATDKPGAGEALHKKAIGYLETLAPYRRLSSDVFLWSETGFKSVLNHSVAEQVITALRKRAPNIQAEVVDPEHVAVLTQRGVRMLQFQDTFANCSQEPDCLIGTDAYAVEMLAKLPPLTP